ncbi:MAG: AraC family transcriptional regulator [Oleiphilaceae bacterium]|nr:AraC family transcriptional regulator [Oleiphilaceae bacterium]
MENLTVSRHFVMAALGGARRQGYDWEQMLRDAGIAPERLNSKRSRVTGAQFSRLLQLIWTRMQDEFMGFAPRPSRPGSFATLCQLAIACHNLESVLHRASRFYGLFEGLPTVRLRYEGEFAALEIHSTEPLDDPDYFLHESLLVIWHRLCSWLIGQGIVLDEAYFSYPEPPHHAEYRGLFHCPLYFNRSDTGLRFHRRFLAMPVIRDEPEMQQFLQTSPADLLARPDDRNSHTARIRAMIGRDFTDQIPDFETIACQMHMSPQTLRRRLKAENTSFQEIKDNLRRDIAIYHLSRNEYAINDIAHLAGFTEPSTFHRAFKKWTGVTPGAYRGGER